MQNLVSDVALFISVFLCVPHSLTKTTVPGWVQISGQRNLIVKIIYSIFFFCSKPLAILLLLWEFVFYFIFSSLHNYQPYFSSLATGFRGYDMFLFNILYLWLYESFLWWHWFLGWTVFTWLFPSGCAEFSTPPSSCSPELHSCWLERFQGQGAGSSFCSA